MSEQKNQAGKMNTKDQQKRLFTAAGRNDAPAIKALVSEKINLRSVNAVGETAIEHAAKLGNREVVELLLDHGFSVHETFKDGRTLLQIMVSSILYNVDAAYMTLQDFGVCFFDPVERSHLDTIQLLLNRGADPHAKGSSDRSTYDYVRNSDEDVRTQILALLNAKIRESKQSPASSMSKSGFPPPYIPSAVNKMEEQLDEEQPGLVVAPSHGGAIG